MTPAAVSVLLLAALAGGRQVPIPRVEKMPNHPRPYVMRDWAKVARDYDAFVFDFARKGKHLPLIWWDETKHNYPFRGFGLPSYVGTAYQARDNQHESINCMAAVVGATLVGIDKSRQNGHDFVRMCRKYFNRDNGQRLYLNSAVHGTGGSFWYETYPSVIFAQLLWLYPKAGEMASHMRITADRMREAIAAMRDGSGAVDFDHTAFDYRAMKPRDNGRWKEPDAAAGYAWFEYMTYVKTGEEKYLQAADECMRFLQRRKKNPYYEILMTYGAYLAARMNAELGRAYDVDKMVNWCFGPSVSRPGWGIIADRWGDVDVSGLAASIIDGGGYAFAMNTFDQASVLTPLVRYDDRYARAIGKYVLNCANSSRLFYANAHSDANQNSAAWARKYDKDSCIAYEGCRKLGRRCATARADHKTAAGEVVSGDVAATRVIHEVPRTRYQVLRERNAGGHDRLDHTWVIDLPPHVGAWLKVDARCDDAGDADEGFRFSYATKPGGPYKPMFTVRALAKGARRPYYIYGLPLGIHGTLYVRVEDTDRTGGQSRPDTIRLDALHIVYQFDTKGPFGMGDTVGGRPGDVGTDLGLYGSSHVGYLGGIVRTTNVAEVLQLDLLKTDWHHDRAYPTYLYFNPHAEAKGVELDVGSRPRDLYDAVGNRFLRKGCRGRTAVEVPADAAVVVVVCPAAGKLVRDGRKTRIDGVIVNYRSGPSPAGPQGPNARLRASRANP